MHPKLIDIITQDAISLFRLDEVKLFDMKVRYGCRYLETRYESQPIVEKTLKAHPNFWAWWRELWAQRDRDLIGACKMKGYGIDYSYPINSVHNATHPIISTKEIFIEELEEFYEDWHYWSKVKFYPNEEMIRECLGEMQHEKIKC